MKLSEMKNENKSSKNLSPLYVLERKINLKTLIIFTVVSALLLFLVVAMFPLMEDALAQIKEMFKDNPEMQQTIVEMMGADNIGAYFVMQGGQIWGLVACIYAACLGCTLICGNLKDGSYEMLYTQNVSRAQIIKHKFFRMLINLTIFNLTCGLVGLIAMLIWGYGEFNVLNYFVYLLFVIIMTIQIGSLSFGLALLGKRKYTVFLSVVMAVAFYFLATLGIAGENFEFFNYLTPFAVAFNDVLNLGIGSINYWSVGIWTVVPTVLVLLGLKSYKNSDLV